MAKRILFQGDSITDCGRTAPNGGFGIGYPCFVKAQLEYEYPGEYEFINAGISGNRVVDLYARIKADFINIAPDYASIYIGVNDTWHEIEHRNGVDTEKFEKIYTMLLDEVKAACPDIKLMIMTPFVLEGPATCNTEEIPNKFKLFKTDVAEKAGVAKKMAKKYGLPCIELQPIFDEACTRAPVAHWTGDGVHPTSADHEMIKRHWIAVFEQMI